MNPEEITGKFGVGLLVQEHAEEAAIHCQRAALVVDKAKFLEVIHEMTHARTGGADHLGQTLLINAGKDGFDSTFLAKMSQEQKNASQTFLARVEKLVDEVFLVSDVA